MANEGRHPDLPLWVNVVNPADFPGGSSAGNDTVNQGLPNGGGALAWPVATGLDATLIAAKTDLDTILGWLDVNLSTRAADATVAATNTSLGTDGTSPPAAGTPSGSTGVRGWLRGIFEKLVASIAITAASLPLPANAAQETGGNLATIASSLDVALSTRASEATLAAFKTANHTDLAAIQSAITAQGANPTNYALETGGNLTTIAGRLNVQLSTRASESTLSAAKTDLDGILAKLDVALSTRASESTLASIKTDLDEIALDTDKLANLDITLSALRDALRGTSNKTLTDLDTDLANIYARLDVALSTRASEATLAAAKADLDELLLDTDNLALIYTRLADTTQTAQALARLPAQPIVVAGTVQPSAATTSVTINVPGGTADGDYLVATVYVAGNVAFTPPAGWTLVQNTLGSTNRMAMWVRRAASEPASYTWSWDLSRACVANMVAVRNVDTASPIVGFNSATAASGTAITFADTAVVAGSMVLGFFATEATAAVTAPPLWTTIQSNSANRGSVSADRLYPSDGSTGIVTATAASGGSNIGQSISLRPTSSLVILQMDARKNLEVTDWKSKPEAGDVLNGAAKTNGAIVIRIPAGLTWIGTLSASISVANGAAANNPALTGLAGMDWTPGTGGNPAAYRPIEVEATAAQTLLSAVIGTAAANSKTIQNIVLVAGSTDATLVAVFTNASGGQVEAHGTLS